MSGTAARPALRSKLAVSLDALLAGDEPWASSSGSHGGPASAQPSPSKRGGKSAAAPRARFYADLLCLPCDAALVRDALGAVSSATLLAPEGTKGARIRENVGSLWREAGRVWREEDAVRMGNAVEMLFAISSSILSKRLPQYASDIISILAGGMDEADLEFSLLVAAIDEALRAPLSHSASTAPRTAEAGAVTPALQRRVLQLALVWVSHVGPTPLAAYFAARRDLWSTAAALLARSFGNVQVASEAAQLLGLLSALGPSGPASTAHAYARRMRDWRDTQSMGLLRDASASRLGEALTSYVERLDDAPPTLATMLAGAANFKWLAESLPGSTSAKEREKAKGELAGGDFADLPPPSVAILLSLFLFARSNPIFIGRLLDRASLDASTDGNGAKLDPAQTFSVTFLSLSSYLASHGSSTFTSRSYARLTLLLLTTMLSDADGARAMLDERPDEARLVRVCRQKPPPLPVSSTKRVRLVSSVIDTATLFLRHNLSRRLDATGHLLSLRLVRAAVQSCSDAKVRLEHEWIETWRAVLALASFVASRHAEIRATDCEELVRAIMATLGLALARSDEYLASPKAAHELTYEIVRAGHTLRRLVQLLLPSAPSGPDSLASSGTRSPLASAPASRSASGMTSPSLLSDASFLPLPPKLYASVPGWRTTERVIAAVEAKVDEWAESRKTGSYFAFARSATTAAVTPASTGDSTPTSAASGRSTPSVHADSGTILRLIASIDAETLLAGAERQMDASSGGATADGDAWLDATADACLAESLRLAGEDVRAQIFGMTRQ